MNKTRFSIKEMAEIVCKDTRFPLNDANITEFLIDSRQLGDAENTLFCAIKTEKNDGHLYVNVLFDKGVRNFMVSSTTMVSDKVVKNSNILLVDDVVKALQLLAADYRSKLHYPILGITGSNGKTIVKEWLYQLLSPYITVARSPKSYNSQIGVALSVLSLPVNCQLGIIEAGISQVGEMSRLEKMICPEYGIITNVGKAHAQNFENRRQIIDEKTKLFEHAQTIIYCADDDDIDDMLHRKYHDKNLIGWHVSDKNIADEMQNAQNFLHNQASQENFLHCAAFIRNFPPARNINLDPEKLNQIELRLEYKDGVNNCLIINDSYSLDIKSFQIAVGDLVQQHRFKSKTIIVSDFPDVKHQDDKMYAEVAQIVNNQNIDNVILIGQEITRYGSLFRANVTCYAATEDFIRHYNSAMFINTAVLLKGARKFHFEDIGKLLQKKEHETVLEVNVDAITSNLSIVKSRLKSTTKLLVMVKAFSYGSGSVEIASILQSCGVDYVAVAFVDEGIELRQAGITMPVIVMNPEISALDAMLKFNLEPEVYSMKKLEAICSLAKIRFNNERKLKLHIKVDTGMHRLGFSKEQLPEMTKILSNNDDSVEVCSVFSHLACADMAERDEFTLGQIRLFEEMSNEIEAATGHKIMRHILNSYGIARFGEYQFDMVRLGIGLYGAEDNLNKLMNLQPALRLTSRISQIRKVAAGEGLGYGLTWTAQRDTRIAVVPIGYADGFRIAMSNSNYPVFINGKYAPVVGRVCMDMCFVDVGDVEADEGDEVEIFGGNCPLSKLAATASTIPYEIISTLSQRIKRVYYR